MYLKLKQSSSMKVASDQGSKTQVRSIDAVQFRDFVSLWELRFISRYKNQDRIQI